VSATVRTPHAPAGRSRIYGLGSVFAKTLRDSRRATLAVAIVVPGLLLLFAMAIAAEFSTPASRRELAAIVAAVPPIMQGLAGKPVNVETLGGYISYKYGTFLPLVVSLWSILALSGTLAGEARRGSLEFLVAAPMTRRRIALQKVSGHLVALGLATLAIFLALAFIGTAVVPLPGDEISLEMAFGYASLLAVLALAAGSLAFAVAQFVGRGAAVGIAGAVMFGGFITSGYQTAIPALAPLAGLSWFGWTYEHVPLGGQFDWAPVALVAALAVVLFAIGIEAFVRRDLGATSAIPVPAMPRALVGLAGPTGRAISEMLPTAVSWGIGLGIFGLMIAGSGRAFIDQLAAIPEFMELLEAVFPGVDIASTGGFLQLLFVEFGLVLAGLAAATLVAKWASDETSGRLEILLASPLSRIHWVLAGGLATLVAIGLIVVVTMLGILAGALITNDQIVTPLVGTLVIAFYAAAIAGIGFAVGGVFGTGIAGPVAALFTILTWFVDIIGPALKLPDVVQSLALSSHFGQPMLAQWDPVGLVLCVVLAIGGVLVGAWGFARRDLRG
jgi:ABC-2 type transport system permease protein